jgi:pilus assembly protein CpaF
MAPDIAIVGEVRDREALPLLLTLSSGVKGFTTIHAGSARQALTRLRFVAQLSDSGHDLSVASLTSLVTEAVDIVVHSARRPGGPVVTSIMAVEDLTGAADNGQFTTTEVFARRGDGELAWTGHLPTRAAHAFADADLDIRSVLDTIDRQP